MNTLMKAAIAATFVMSAVPSFAHEQDDVATVIAAVPVYERVSAPRDECWTEQVTSYREQRVVTPGRTEYYSEPRSGPGAGTLLGAIIGGAIGHQFGESSGGRDRGTGAGALIGGMIGHDIEKQNATGGYRRASGETMQVERVPVMREVQHCRPVSDYRQQVAYYDVRYRFHGREFATRMNYHPGPTLRINVDVRPHSHHPVPSYVRPY
jgi:uncharacterized protein YcfJ